jgi:hypothetical protein
MCVSVPSWAQALTVLAAKSALEGAIAELRKALADTTNDLQSLGNSLQANAQNVVFDVDRTLGSKINLTFDRLDATELRLIEDVQTLTKQVQTATSQIVSKAGDEARKTIVEADIAAYNASYSLPCRSASPRVVASFPARLIARRSAAVLQLKGNFLRQGNVSVTVNDRPARVVERLDTSLTVELPSEVVNSVKDDEVVASAIVNGLERIERAPRLWGLFGCGESRYVVLEKPIGLSIIKPPYYLSMIGTLRYDYTATRDVVEPEQQFSRKGSDQCDDNSRADQQWCVTAGTLANVQVRDVRANCNSGYEGTVPSGDRCVLARGKVAGCGANRGPFNTWLGCKGRGRLNYKIQLTRQETFQASTQDSQVMRTGAPGTWSFAVDMPNPAGLKSPLPRYNVSLNLMQGRNVISTFAITHANPNISPVTSRVNGGVLAIEADPTGLQLNP